MEFGILSLIPPLVTVIMAFLTRQIVISLLVGIFTGATIIAGFDPIAGFFSTFDTFVIPAAVSSSRISILVFTLTISGMIAVVSAMGGTAAIAKSLSKNVKTARGAQLMTSLAGCLVFFDDYANILIVGPTMQPLSDNLKVSREKLTYIVHTTAGIVAGVAIMTTWIGFEISLVTEAFDGLGYEVNGFLIVLQNIPYMFYNLLAIVISFMIAYSMRDFGPMYKAEKRARLTGKLVADDAIISDTDDVSTNAAQEEKVEGKIIYALLPILTMVLVTFFGIWASGYAGLEEEVSFLSFEGLRLSFGMADPMPPIVWAAVLSSLVACGIAIFKMKFSISKTYKIWLKGFLDLGEVAIILVLAWAIGGVVSTMGTAEYLISIVSGNISAGFIPAIVFLVSCIISFSTGTSWGTMPIVFPIAIPLIAAFVDDPTQSPLVLATIAAVLSGSIFGDQTSPISDSSIISAATTRCDLMHHIKTQIPYALVPAGLATLSYLLVGFLSLNPWVCLLIGIVILALVIKFFGKSTKYEDLIKEKE